MKKSIRLALLITLGLTGFLLLFQLAGYVRYVNTEQQAALESGLAAKDALKFRIESLLAKLKKAGEALGETFAEGDFADHEVKALIRRASLAHPEIRGVTVCYQPFGFSKQRRLYCPYYNKASQSFVAVEDSYDYTKPGKDTAWYLDIVNKGAGWVDPYYGKAAKEWYVDYGVPFLYRSGPLKGKVRGIIDFSLEVGDFKRLVHSFTDGKTGYGLIVSKSGQFITHPINDYVGTKSVQDLMNSTTPPGLKKAYEGLMAGQTGHSEFHDKKNDDTSLFIYDRIGASGLGLGMVFFKRDLLGDQWEKNKRYINICLTFSLLLVLALTLYFSRDRLDRGEIETIGVLSSLLLVMNIALIGFLVHTTGKQQTSKMSLPIVDMASLGNFIGQQVSRAETLKLSPPIVVPTGLYIERLEFQDSHNVNLAGIIWQKYPLGIPDIVKPGFRFPQMSPFAEASYVEEAYRETVKGKEGEAGYQLIGWDYRVTLRLDLKYTHFPFDKRHLDIRIRPASSNHNLLFVPDLGSYDYSSPLKKGGINPQISLSGNEITRSYFSFTSEHFDTNFGFSSKSFFENVPVLHYNIHIRRYLLNPFVTYLIPIVVTLCMIYILIMACAKSEARQGIIESMAAFFFVLIFSHIDLRKHIVTAELTFMEYFYFITYLLIIFSTLNLMAYTKSRTTLFDYNDNQIYRVVYLPFFFLLVLIVMLAKFY